ncbi:uncharacterized protein LOC100875855 [Megachile rotundata]|uniref:uncharacterized protein LOC100875855 n=1 Tax=Megachile rotundata TaxID=143995 RepID=UPI000614E1FE|nr:PREDICTED: proline-rich protein 2-like [Megachile rotundata]XP_012138034.1 PREDICTED: proline-rich protein 2-like [Megachile rotundata]
MKKILSFLMLLCVAKGNPVASWGGYQWNMPYQWQYPPRYSPPLLGPFFRPPGQAPPPPGPPFSPPGYNCPPPPEHFCLLPKDIPPITCQQLVYLQSNQQSNSMDDRCNIGLVCRNSKTGDITITTPYEEPIIISGQSNSTNPVTPKPDNTEEPPHHGGEGLIDIRSNTESKKY